MFVHKTTKSAQICGDAGDAHNRTFGWSVTPRLVVAGKNSQVTATNKVVIVQTEQWIGRAQKFRMENDLEK